MKLTDMNQFLATQTLKNQDLIKDILLIFCCFYGDKMTENMKKYHHLLSRLCFSLSSVQSSAPLTPPVSLPSSAFKLSYIHRQILTVTDVVSCQVLSSFLL